MNPVKSISSPKPSWQQHMKAAIRSQPELLRRLGLPIDDFSEHEKSAFPLFAPLPYVGRIQPSDPCDPLLLQILIRPEEQQTTPGFLADPLCEQSFQMSPGLLQKYKSRALLVVNGSCAIHCRYCFRRNYPYHESPQSTGNWQQAISQLLQDESIEEVVLSGGDPLTMVDGQLSGLISQLESIPHLRRLRIHTRVPVVIPNRVTKPFLDLIENTRLTPTIVVHCNHANELDDETTQSLVQLSRTRATLLNQSVLLRGVNDSVERLSKLSIQLHQAGVIPYYLHQLDPVQGSAHFQVPTDKGIQLVKDMRNRLSGYLVPRYVQEIAGRSSKTLLA